MAKKISDELREWGYGFCGDTYDVVTAIADRIDSEMVELPKDKDGVPIHVGDMMWDYMTGRKMTVTTLSTLSMRDSGWYVFTDKAGYVKASHLTHAQPDSWERIAAELDEVVDAARWADDSCEKLADLAERIRRLAKEDGGNDDED